MRSIAHHFVLVGALASAAPAAAIPMVGLSSFGLAGGRGLVHFDSSNAGGVPQARIVVTGLATNEVLDAMTEVAA